MAMTKVTCKRCSGTGQVAHLTARHNATCFCCGGKGFYYRKPAQKRETEAEYLARMNATIQREFCS